MRSILYTVVVVLFFGCQTNYVFRSTYKDSNELLHAHDTLAARPFLKAHLVNGDVCILRDTWQVDTVSSVINGTGTRYGPDRIQSTSGQQTLPFDSIALLETNKKIENAESGRLAALALLTAVDVSMTIFCATNPKACFGSCPTFYMDSTDDFHYADAEGFSDAVLPSMEYTDIDALEPRPDGSGLFSITMRNEALETHCVKQVGLLAVPLKDGESVYHGSDGAFYASNGSRPLVKATAEEGDMTSLLFAPDRRERFSLSDPNNILSKEEVVLEFDPVEPTAETGLVLHFRQTLLSTYLFYSAMGYMGDQVTDYFTLVETDSVSRRKFDGVMRLLGGIEVYRWVDSTAGWRFLRTVGETGPIAINRQLIEAGDVLADVPVRMKLVMNRGMWRLDYASLAIITGRVYPLESAPVRVMKKGIEDSAAKAALASDDRYLFSMPGDAYRIDFALPPVDGGYQLFLKTRGYYLEWMRSHWLDDKDLVRLRMLAEHPERYLRREAARYKRYESTMEKEFWDSRIDTKSFTYEGK